MSEERKHPDFYIAVINANTEIGLATIQALSVNTAAQIKIRAIIDNKEAESKFTDYKNAEVVVADTSVKAVTEAFKGVHTIIVILGDDKREYITKNYIAAAKASNCKAAVVVSHSLAGVEKYPIGKEFGAIEALWTGSGLGYTFLRIPYLLDNELSFAESIKSSSTISTPAKPESKYTYLCVSDVGRACKAASFHTHQHKDKTYHLVQQMDPVLLDGQELAKVYSEVLGKPITYKQTNRADYTGELIKSGVSKGRTDALADFWAAVDDAEPVPIVNTPTHDYSRVTGLHSTTVKNLLTFHKAKFE